MYASARCPDLEGRRGITVQPKTCADAAQQSSAPTGSGRMFAWRLRPQKNFQFRESLAMRGKPRQTIIPDIGTVLEASGGRFSARRSDLHIKAKVLGDGENVFVATAAHVHHHDVVGRQFGRDLHYMGQCMAGFQRRNDAFKRA